MNLIQGQEIKRIVNSVNTSNINEDYYTKSYNFRRNNQNIVIEAENFKDQTATSKRQWYRVSSSKKPNIKKDPDTDHLLGASDGVYLELLPNTFCNKIGKKI